MSGGHNILGGTTYPPTQLTCSACLINRADGEAREAAQRVRGLVSVINFVRWTRLRGDLFSVTALATTQDFSKSSPVCHDNK